MASVNGDFLFPTNDQLPAYSQNHGLTEKQSKTKEIAKDQFDNTELHKACQHPFKAKLIKTLSKNSFNLLSKNEDGELPLHILSKHDRLGNKILEMINKHPAITTELLTSKDNCEMTPVMIMLTYRSNGGLKKTLSFLDQQYLQTTSILHDSTTLASPIIKLVQNYLNPISNIVNSKNVLGLSLTNIASKNNLDLKTLRIILQYSNPKKSGTKTLAVKLKSLHKKRNKKNYYKRKKRASANLELMTRNNKKCRTS